MPMSPRLLRPRAAVSTGFDPRQIAGLALWLDAGDSGSITLNGSNVEEWRDKSGNGYRVAQSVANNRPILETVAGLGGRQAILFDGTNDVLINTTTGILASGTPEMSMVIAHRVTTATVSGGRALFDISQGATYAGTGTIRRLLTSQSYMGSSAYFAFGLRDQVYGNSVSAANTSYIHSLVLGSGATSATNPLYYRNGAASTRTGVNGSDGTPTFTPSRFAIGNNAHAANEAYSGHVAEVCLFSRAISDAERQAVERYLGNKYGISLS